MKKSKRTGIVVAIYSGKKGKWEVYASLSKGRKKKITITDINDVTHTGNFEFGTRLIARNGNLIAMNPVQFNTFHSAWKNVMAVKASA